MAISEHARHELYRRLEDLLGGEAATTLMEHLPPVGWADVATKRDLEVMEQRLRADVRAEIHAGITSAITSQTRTLLVAVVGSNLSIAGLAFAAAGLR